MKKIAFATIILAMALPTGSALAQQKMKDMNMKDMKCTDMKDMKCMDMKDMEMAAKPAANQEVTHVAKGVVKKIDSKSSTVTIAHESIPSLNWPAMTMGFKVKDKMLLDKLSSGKAVEFQFKKEGKDFVVTAVK